jgi:AraC family transcriptional regulator
VEASVVELESFEVVGVRFEANLEEIRDSDLGKKAYDSVISRAAEVDGRVSDDVYLIQIYPMKDNFNPNVGL